MSTLVAQTISNGTVSTSSANVIQGSAKAWVRFNGGDGNTAGVINASFNVSSVTANSAGNFTINFTTAMPNTNYVLTGTTKTYNGDRLCVICEPFSGTRTTSALQILAGGSGAATSSGFVFALPNISVAILST